MTKGKEKKSYKQKYEELLLEEHTKNYIHIPFSWKGLGRFALFLVSLGLSISNLFLILFTGSLLKLGDLSKENLNGFHQLLILYPLIGEYILISSTIIAFYAVLTGGNIKSRNEDGLIGGLIDGLIGGLIGGLIIGLIVGLICGLIVGLIVGLIIGLIVGLIRGLIGGFVDEFT